MLQSLSLVEMAAQIRSRKLSPVEVIDAHLQQIERVNPRINAFIRVLADDARAAASVAEQAQMRGDFAGPLHGIPVTIKDSFDMAGYPTTCGSRFFQDLRASQDATAVHLLKQAGAIPIGKTNCPEFLANYESDNFIVGRTNNPWNLERTAGGSSGGEGAAIAAACSAGGIGSDGGGSVRIPAHFCGIAGLKPTPGRIPATGHVPEISHPGGLLGVAGPMARNARDLKMLFEVLAIYDPQDPFSAPVPLREADVSTVRIGVMEQFYRVPVQTSVRLAVHKAASAALDLGFVVDGFQSHGLERAPNLWWFFFGELPARITKELIAGREDQAHWTATEFLEKALSESEPTAKQLLQNLAIRDKMRAALVREMANCPVLLLPACGVTAFEHRQRRYQTDQKEIGQFEAMMPATPFNLLGFPAVTIPFGRDDHGLPVGVQLVARPYEEELLLDLAIRLEEARGPFGLPPIAQ
jgi:Asp-tRNA(Asn)/Glu-tRNA(Gln) amidotransferase A subunit family amidase